MKDFISGIRMKILFIKNVSNLRVYPYSLLLQLILLIKIHIVK